MPELEKILEEIIKKSFCVEIREYESETVVLLDDVEEILKKHMDDGWIPVEDERLWDILFEEACVEGEQARRNYNRLKETFDEERSEMNGKL